MNFKKPMTLLAEDFQRNLVGLINNSGLPYFVIRSILKDAVEEATLASQRQLAMDKQSYNEALRKEQEKIKDDNQEV